MQSSLAIFLKMYYLTFGRINQSKIRIANVTYGIFFSSIVEFCTKEESQ